ncbi:8-hydroxygeraniol oxidoreductase-like [Ricinus communis]|uniref:8-hydroxygeraniol oxidoreductase-like n=1 Tax=Ricinus communis TaxID=3988 RepID=UPI00201A2AAE|nr:8-hydroxygeraniol oxidoreductase-like [Ricinus communis]XP_048235784.1 8-hydroxygeraniol oxidoreductase-like [Ricinus communis]
MWRRAAAVRRGNESGRDTSGSSKINRSSATLPPTSRASKELELWRALGDKVKDLKEGDTVMPGYLGGCQECENCTSGKTNLCLKYPLPLTGLMSDGTSRMSVKGQKFYHLFSCSTWSVYPVIDVNYVVKIDPSVNLAMHPYSLVGILLDLGQHPRLPMLSKGVYYCCYWT